ncbi:glycosyltransferase [Enterococcus sp. BWM-S5]|uniref:Glycosyltransferase n=1 Tax=Enterococcus larvae TaxID=2794352 RepID=A0ABS4CI97_9ENTE|nr:glycosyltransferase [Enterococcus larvae]MBP1046351.1 glycosyltransferase [Enterococcus larvae]
MRKICAGVITFNPDIELLENNLAILRKQVERVYIIDNGSSNIEQIKLIDKEISVVGFSENVGIAKALNRLMMEADKEGFEWVLSMDQDTLIQPNVIESYSRYIDDPTIGMLTLRVIRKSSSGEILFETSTENEYDYVERCPTSGMLLETAAWKEAGGYDDWLFIDYVDYDMCQKVLLLNKKIVRVNDTYMIQQLGDGAELSIVGRMIESLSSDKMKKKTIVFNHNPVRNYYFVRNSIYFMRKYKKHIKVSSELKKVTKWEVKKLIFEKRFFAQFGAMLRGISAGMRAKITR